VSSQIRSLVQFSQLNLMDDWRMPQVDLIFCRNVIIYFDKPTKQRLIERFAEVLPVGGYLFVGHSESLYKTTQRFELVGNTVYRKVA
jgi:chemotaxis protein methyltransferase CheR